jgi:DNA-binding NarL/FixJ family response regulator
MSESLNETSPPLRVLLAEASSLVREGLCQVLAELDGVTVVAEAGSCADLQRLLPLTEPDLLLLDLALPCADLFSLMATQKLARPHLHIFALSYLRSSRLDQRCRNAGANYVISKTTGLDQLVEVVRDLAQQPRRVPGPPPKSNR